MSEAPTSAWLDRVRLLRGRGKSGRLRRGSSGLFARGGISSRPQQEEAHAGLVEGDGGGALFLRRDLDSAASATDLEHRDWARGQFDRAELDGIAAILRVRLVSLCDLTGAELAYQWAFIQTLGPVLSRDAGERSATDAAVLDAAWSASAPTEVDMTALLMALDAYPCG